VWYVMLPTADEVRIRERGLRFLVGTVLGMRRGTLTLVVECFGVKNPGLWFTFLAVDVEVKKCVLIERVDIKLLNYDRLSE
jgi:hypothetical protein